MNYDGIILQILPAETIQTAGGDRQKQTIVLEENRDTEYKGGIVIDFWGEKLGLLNGLQIGDNVNVGLNTKAREYNGKWYNAVTGWKLEKSGGGAPAPAPVAAAAASTVATPPNSTTAPQDAPAPAPATKAEPAAEAKTQEYEDELPF